MSKYLFAGLAIALFVLVLVGPIPVPPSLGRGDFRAYWSAAYLLAQSENFADADLLLQTEQEHTEWTEDWAVITWNPPWLLAILLPYTAVSFPRATWLWLLTNIALVFTGSVLLWKTFTTQKSSQRWGPLAPLAGLLFLPTMLALLMGQVNTLVFLGLALFLFFFNRNQLFAAGLSLVLTLVKPHLVYLVLPIIFLHLLWTRRDFKAAAGLLVGLVVLTAVVFGLRPSFITDFSQTVGEGNLLGWETPTLGGFLGTTFGWQWAKLMGLVVLPLTVGLWWRYRDSVNLNSWVPATLLVSVISAPFGWGYDVIVLLLPVLQLAAWIAEGRFTQTEAIGWGVLLVGINLAAIYQRSLEISEGQTFWVPIALAITYFIASYRQNKRLALLAQRI
ncbi:MAG: glycosyltransferase family 87 protein [Chloroflexota bacterium]